MSIVTSRTENGVLYLELNDRVDTSTVPQAEAEIAAIRAKDPNKNIVIDAENLVYISSAGLRAILKLRKEVPTLKVINASSEVYDIFEMTGFSEIMPVEKAYRKFSVEGCDIIGRGAKGTVYRLNEDTIIKVFKNADCLPDIQNERELAKKAFVLGVPTAIPYDVVKVGESFGSVFELLSAKSFSELLAEDASNLELCASEYANLLRNIQKLVVKDDALPLIKPRMINRLISIRDLLSEEDYDKFMKLLEETEETHTFLHNDYHTNNLMRQNGETLLIDMDTIGQGNPVFELMNIYASYVGFTKIDPMNSMNFLGISAELAEVFWNRFLRIYLDTEDETALREVTDKAALLSAMRQIRHYRKRDPESEKTKKAITEGLSEIHELLGRLDTLNL